MTDIDLQEEYRSIGASYEAFAALLDEPDEALYRAREAVSAWSPAQHLYHILVANGMMLSGVALICRSHAMVLPEGALNAAGRAVLTQGRFPRGQGKAPERTQPPAEVSRETLRQALARSRARYEQTASLLADIPAAQGYIPHGFLGQLTAAQWLRLTRIHSEHHLAIIREIAGQEAA